MRERPDDAGPRENWVPHPSEAEPPHDLTPEQIAADVVDALPCDLTHQRDAEQAERIIAQALRDYAQAAPLTPEQRERLERMRQEWFSTAIFGRINGEVADDVRWLISLVDRPATAQGKYPGLTSSQEFMDEKHEEQSR